VQITYTKPDGSKYFRVLTEVLKVSHERDELTEKADEEIIVSNVVQ